MSIFMDIYRENKEVFESIKDELTEKVVADLRKYGATRIYIGNNKKPLEIKRYPDGGDYAKVPVGIVPHINDFFFRNDLKVTIDRWHNGEPRCIKIMY